MIAAVLVIIAVMLERNVRSPARPSPMHLLDPASAASRMKDALQELTVHLRGLGPVGEARTLRMARPMPPELLLSAAIIVAVVLIIAVLLGRNDRRH